MARTFLTCYGGSGDYPTFAINLCISNWGDGYIDKISGRQSSNVRGGAVVAIQIGRITGGLYGYDCRISRA